MNENSTTAAAALGGLTPENLPTERSHGKSVTARLTAIAVGVMARAIRCPDGCGNEVLRLQCVADRHSGSKARRALTAFLDHLDKSGHAILPREATEEMIQRGGEANCPAITLTRARLYAVDVYRAMRDAALGGKDSV